MDRSTLRTALPAAQPGTLLPLDLDEDPADESIYGMGYRARVGVVVSDRPAPQPAAESEAVALPGTDAQR